MLSWDQTNIGAPEQYQYPTFLLNSFSVICEIATKDYNDLQQSSTIDSRLVNGFTFLLPNKKETNELKLCNLIPCLTTLYKILTYL